MDDPETARPANSGAAATMTARVMPADAQGENKDRPAPHTDTITLPKIFATPFRPDLIRKAFVNISSHSFQPQGRHPTAGMDVVADTNDPPTGRGIARIARATGGGGRRRGEGAEVASTRGGRQAHPPTSEKRTYKKLNKKEGRLAFCSAVAATASRSLVESRGHAVSGYVNGAGGTFPIVVDDSILQYRTAREVTGLLERLNLLEDVRRLSGRKARSGRPLLRGRQKKRGKSVLFVTHVSGNGAQSQSTAAQPLKNAVGALPGVDARSVGDLSVLDLAPGADPARLTMFTRSAIEQLGGIRSTHLQTMIEDDRIGYREDPHSSDAGAAGGGGDDDDDGVDDVPAGDAPDGAGAGQDRVGGNSDALADEEEEHAR